MRRGKATDNELSPEEKKKSWRYGFPMDFKSYEYGRPMLEAPADGVVLGVFAKNNDGDPLLSKAGDEMRRIVCGFEGPEGRCQIDFYAVGGYYDNFVQHVLPEEWAVLKALGDGEEYDVKDHKAWGRLVRVDIVLEEYEGKTRGKIKRFRTPSAELLAKYPDGKGGGSDSDDTSFDTSAFDTAEAETSEIEF